MTPEPEMESRIVDVDELLVRPGTYFNPQTEVLVVVDDSSSIDQGIFNMEAYEGAEWVRITDEVPLDEQRRDESLESFQSEYHPTAATAATAAVLEGDEEEPEPEEEPAGAEQPAPEPRADE